MRTNYKLTKFYNMKAFRLISGNVTIVVTEKEMYFSHIKCVIKLEEGQFSKIIESVIKNDSIIIEQIN